MKNISLIAIILFSTITFSQSKKITNDINNIEKKVIEWRRHFHQNPELSNREFKTAKAISKHLKSLNIEVIENVAKTGVVGILKGNKPGKVVALRADIDALPVVERNNLPFKSTKKNKFFR